MVQSDPSWLAWFDQKIAGPFSVGIGIMEAPHMHIRALFLFLDFLAGIFLGWQKEALGLGSQPSPSLSLYPIW